MADAADQVSSDTDYASSDKSTDDGAVLEVLEPYQYRRCRCTQPTLRMTLVPGESEFRCFECLYAHCDQSAEYPHQIRRALQGGAPTESASASVMATRMDEAMGNDEQAGSASFPTTQDRMSDGSQAVDHGEEKFSAPVDHGHEES